MYKCVRLKVSLNRPPPPKNGTISPHKKKRKGLLLSIYEVKNVHVSQQQTTIFNTSYEQLYSYALMDECQLTYQANAK